MSNFEENRTHLKLEYNDDGTATLLTDHSYYKNFDIKFDKSVVDDNLRGIDETDYYFTMLVNESKLTIHKDKWEISLGHPINTPSANLCCGSIKKDGSKIICTNLVT